MLLSLLSNFQWLSEKEFSLNVSAITHCLAWTYVVHAVNLVKLRYFIHQFGLSEHQWIHQRKKPVELDWVTFNKSNSKEKEFDILELP